MMSLTEVNVFDVAKKQFTYKLRANSTVFAGMIGVQLIAILFSLNGTGMSGSGSNNLFISFTSYSGNIIILFTMFWSFILAYTMTTKTQKDMDFTFVSNRQSSNISNGLFLITTSCISGATAVLAGFLLKTIIYFTFGQEAILMESVSPYELIGGILITIFYILLISSIGYFVGSLMQLNKLLKFLVPTLFFGSLFISTANTGTVTFITNLLQFFSQEASLFLLTLKILFSVSALFFASIFVSDRMEVK